MFYIATKDIAEHTHLTPGAQAYETHGGERVECKWAAIAIPAHEQEAQALAKVGFPRPKAELAYWPPDYLLQLAERSTQVAAIILNNEGLRARLLSESPYVNGERLHTIALSHSDSARLILTDDVLRKQLLSLSVEADNANTLLGIALVHPDCAQLILGDEVLRELLLPGSEAEKTKMLLSMVGKHPRSAFTRLVLANDALRTQLLRVDVGTIAWLFNTMALSHPDTARLILGTDALRTRLLVGTEEYNAETLQKIALAHLNSARFILETGVLRHKLLHGDIQKRLQTIAFAYPDSAQFILGDEVLRDQLLKRPLIRFVLSDIACAHPDSAHMILKSEHLRGLLLPGSRSPDEKLGELHRITKALMAPKFSGHPSTLIVNELCEKLCSDLKPPTDAPSGPSSPGFRH